MRREAELTRAEETIRREQQQIEEIRQRVSLVCGVVCVLTKGPSDFRSSETGLSSKWVIIDMHSTSIYVDCFYYSIPRKTPL